MLEIDKSWDPIKGLLNEKFRNLPNTSYWPEKKNIFNVFEMPLDKINVVILGQDPYPTQEKDTERPFATGYAFAVDKEIKEIPKSLKVIEEEIEKEKKFGLALANRSNLKEKWQTLKHWRDQGVFLLNAALTVGKKEKGKKADSHLDFWETFTKKVIEYISDNSGKEKHPYPCIWMLWGGEAKKFKGIICKNNGILVNKDNIEEIIKGISKEDKKNYILEAYHPTAYYDKDGNRLFLKNDNFLYANRILGKNEIKW